MIWSIIGSIAGKVLDIVDRVVEGKDEDNRLKFGIQGQLIENMSSELEAAAKIVLMEAQGPVASTQQANLLMMAFAGPVVARGLGFTAPNIPETIHSSLLNNVMVGIGGYVVDRFGEKIADKFKGPN